MKNKKVIGIRLFGAVCVIMIAICMITQGTIKNEDKKPEKLTNKYRISKSSSD